MRHAVASLGKLVVIIVAGCTGSFKPMAMPPPRETVQFPVTVSHDLDLLFLIDDSPSMADKQINLAGSLARLVDSLGLLPGGLPNLRVGVATSDLGTQGALDINPSFGPPVGAGLQGGCSGLGKDGDLQLFGAPVSGAPWLSDVADPVTGARNRNYPGALTDVLAQMTRAGARGCAFEQHLEAIKHALSATNAVNQGFLRPDAELGVIVLADEDDCSASHYALFGNDSATVGPLQSFRCTRFGVLCDRGGQTPDAMNQVGAKDKCHPDDGSPYLTRVGDYAAFLKGLKTDPAKVIVAAIAGTTDAFSVEARTPPGEMVAIPALAHSCTYLGGDINGDGAPDPEVADPPIRIKALLDQFENRSALATICERDLSSAVQQIGDLIRTAMGAPCFEGALADSDPRAPGTQYDCAVSATRSQDPSTKLMLPRCTPEDASATNQPCWHMGTDATSCPNGEHLTPVIEGRSALGGYVTASCVAPAI